MEFVKGVGTRVYPVGRLDYNSEGLLLLTNDGELANVLTRAASKVRKTYLVKVSGKPAESALNQLRSGIMIERGKPGSKQGRVMTAPAEIRLVRDGENPWYEMTLIEGRNREIRKMFEEIGHHVEKIRRVEYGPLVLDIAPGKIRELSQKEVEELRRAVHPKVDRKPGFTKAASKSGPAVKPRKKTQPPEKR
jgi:23S rRNA pseudouridine2605 synthase